MNGCRALTDKEVDDVLSVLKTKRNRLFFLMGIRTGLRVSELLSICIKDVIQHGKITEEVSVARKNTKGQLEGKTLGLDNTAKEAIQLYLDSIPGYTLDEPLFKSAKGNKAITRMQAHRILKDAFNFLELQGKLATHTLRKSYANKAHILLGSKIERTQHALRHKSLTSTIAYIYVDKKEIDEKTKTMWEKVLEKL